MDRAVTTPSSTPLPRKGVVLTGLPRKPMSSADQVQALQRLQSRADQRVKLGVQLFKAAEARLTSHQDLLKTIKQDQQSLREQLRQETTQSLENYDLKLGAMDQSFTSALQSVEARLEAMQAEWTQTQRRINAMLERSQALLEQSEQLIAQQSFATMQPDQTAAADDRDDVSAMRPTDPVVLAPDSEEDPQPKSPVFTQAIEALRQDGRSNVDAA